MCTRSIRQLHPQMVQFTRNNSRITIRGHMLHLKLHNFHNLRLRQNIRIRPLTNEVVRYRENRSGLVA